MCGRYTIFTPPDDLEDRFGATFEQSPKPRYNAAPGQHLPVITNDTPETISHLRWGLIPQWADDPKIGTRLINARAETIDEKRSFRNAYENRRCLVLADGFYEWRSGEDGKQPYRVVLENRDPFAMAGLWERWQPPQKQTGLDEFEDGQPDTEADAVETFSIVTTEPNDVVGELHDRMSVVLSPDDEECWLADGGTDLLQPYSNDGMEAYPVSAAVNDPSNEFPELIEEIDTAA